MSDHEHAAAVSLSQDERLALDSLCDTRRQFDEIATEARRIIAARLAPVQAERDEAQRWVDRARRWEQRTDEARAERDRLAAGIAALADEDETKSFVSKADLRALLAGRGE